MPRFQVRRATVEDLPVLRSLWQTENLPVEVLEKRVTEFHVAQSEQGEVVASLGLQTAEGQGLLHAEAIGWPDLADELRAQLWPRVETMARSPTLSRLWTTLEAPFWKSIGFKKAGDQTLALLPPVFAADQTDWLHLPLRSSRADSEEIDKHVAALRTISQAETERLMARARVLKWIAIGLITVVFAAFAAWVVYFVTYYFRRRSRVTRPGPREL